MVVTPENVGNPEFGVVHHAGEIISGGAVGFDEDLVLDVFRLEGDFPMNHIVDFDRPAFFHPEDYSLAVPVGLSTSKEFLGS